MESNSSYIICTVPRSGSTLLCDLLESTGVAGKPDSYFRRQSMSEYAQYWGLSGVRATESSVPDTTDFMQRYLQAAVAAGTGRGCVFGLRQMPDHHLELQRVLKVLYPQANGDVQRLNNAFGNVRFIYLQRDDSLAQAISRYRAEQSGLWHRHADGSERERVKPPATPQYNFEGIAHYLKEAEHDKDSWCGWFKNNGISPYHIKYESLVANPPAVIGDLLNWLSLDSRAAVSIKPRTARLSDQLSDQWYRRFKQDRIG